ncbi:unnamed protein product [Rotaria sordida]|uniref:Uncharacterized protein n=1 Tax=Rotaria sordida TaxID=392033 RepID=A0A814CJU2_9BILA|nr:unnamed protein product [Rotaria sordida]CAF3752346.1 unnamed protein product [Rotaria sordida]
MRFKHLDAYEQSKTVAQKCLASMNDEDRTLTASKMKLKNTCKDQILNRLAAEWKKLVKNSGANTRTKGIIIGRMQTQEYKNILAEMINQQQINILLDGIAVDTQPPPVQISTSHYENVWSVEIEDNEPIQPKNDIDARLFVSPITWQEIE